MSAAPTRDVLVAAGECVRVINILLDSTSPHSRALAAIVGFRLKALLTGDSPPPRPMDPGEVAHWLALAGVLGQYAVSGDVS